MSLSTAIASFGTLVKVGLSSAAALNADFVTIAGVADIDGPGVSVDEKETTNHSTSTPHKTFTPTLIDDGSLRFPIFYQPTHNTHDNLAGDGSTRPPGLEYLMQNRTTWPFRIVATDPSGTTRQFNGFVKSFGEKYPVNGLMMRDVEIRITSAPSRVSS